MSKKSDKREAQFSHAKRRALERYGIIINQADINRIRKQIEAGEAYERVSKQSNRVSIYLGPLHGLQVLFAYDKNRKMVASFLPPEAYDPVEGFKQTEWRNFLAPSEVLV